MANSIDHHVKLMFGDLMLTIATLAAEKEALAEAAAAAQKAAAPKEPSA